MADFPHISDTSYPIIDNVNPYKYQNIFDYSQYNKEQMRITVCSVPWDVGLIHVGNAQIGGLGNVVYFETKENRDTWFDNLEDKYSWNTKYREYHTDGTIEIPLPYEKAVLYNYVYVEYMRLPVEYADANEKEKFYFFIRSCESLSPNACKLTILRDTWQTFIYDIAPNISYMMLERGHAPMSVSNVDSYLSNPIDNCDYLLAEDINYGTTYVSSIANEIVLNDGDMLACIASDSLLTGNWGSIESGTARTPNGNNYGFGVPSSYCYAVGANEISQLLEDIEGNVPQFIQTIRAIFFIKREFVTISETVQFAKHSVYILSQRSTNIDFVSLAKELFNYDDKYKNLAKLYTYPYSYLEISDESGNIDTIRIEETSGKIGLNITTSLAYPWISIDGNLNGIGAERRSITFANIDKKTFTLNGDWYDHLKRWSIPTFAVRISSELEYAIDNLYTLPQNINAANVEYENALMSATTNKTNSDDSTNLTYNNNMRSFNRAKENSDRTANTNYTLSINSADTERTNADRTARASYDNALDIAAVSQTNALASAQTAQTNSRIAADCELQNLNHHRNLAIDYFNFTHTKKYFPGYALGGLSGAQAKITRVKLEDDFEQDSQLQLYITGVENATMASTTMINGIGSAVQSTIGGAISGGMVGGAGGALGGAITGVIGGTISLATATAAIPVIQSSAINITDRTISVGERKTANAYHYSENMCIANAEFDRDKLNAENKWLGLAGRNSRDSSYTVADNTKATSDANTNRVYMNDVSNANRSYNASIASNYDSQLMQYDNALESKTSSLTNNSELLATQSENALDTKAVELTNNARTFKTAIDIAEAKRDLSLAKIDADKKQGAMSAPVSYGENSNGDTATTRPIGLFCNVVTQTKDAIAQAGDYFLRFGYAANREWDFTTFNLMPKFTYWKCSDMWVQSNNVPDAYMDEIRFFLLGGVCVWRRPEDIGRTSIYENEV